jgi:DNA-binding NarL/FixJ family response regulator
MKANPRIRILLAEDHGIVRQGLRALLTLEGDFEIVGEARTGREAVELARSLEPDVVLMDIAMPILNGVEATRQILSTSSRPKVLILSAHSDDAYIELTRATGVTGFLEKQTSAEILSKAIREVAKGVPFYSPGIAKRLESVAMRARTRKGMENRKVAKLTSRESEVLQLVAEGSANKQVAAALHISVKTVEKHRQHLMEKLGIHETAGLTRYAIAAGVIESSVQLRIV